MKKIDITKEVTRIRSENKDKEQAALATMTLPEWMQKPFDAHFSKKNSAYASDNEQRVIEVDFSRPTLAMPKALAASSMSAEQASWYDQGQLTFKDNNNATVDVAFNKVSDSDAIDITISVIDGESDVLTPYCGLSELSCSLYDNTTELAKLTATINHDGTFMFAEGIVLEDKEPRDSNAFISLHIHH